jgi:arylsulfatase A-like enzyme
MVDGGDAVTHLTGYAYDRMVPLVIAGAGLKAGVHPEYARVIDLAPTLSYLLGILPPSLSEGRVLTEALAK